MAALTKLAALIEHRHFERPRYVLAGTVRDSADAPVAGRAVVALREDRQTIAARAVTRADGGYTLRTACAGPHTLIFSGEPDRNALALAGVVPA